MNRFLITYTTLLTIAQAQLLYEAPACAIPCINRYLTSTTCRSSVNVISCVCQDRSEAAVELTNCVFDAQRCSPYDLAAFSEGLVQLCPEIFSSQAAPR